MTKLLKATSTKKIKKGLLFKSWQFVFVALFLRIVFTPQYVLEIPYNQGPLFAFRQMVASYYKKALPEPHASLVGGMTLGIKSDLPPVFWQRLKKTGTAHVVVASGMNVTLVAGFLTQFFLSFLPRKKAVIFAVAGIWIYSIIAGFEAPIVRAAIMGTMAFGAQALGKVYSAGRALLLSAAVILLARPDWITNLSFILSFAATAGLMLFEKDISSKIRFVPGIFREGLSTSLAAQIGVTPIMVFAFGSFNPISPIINALVLWTVTPTTVIGFVGGLVGIILPIVGKLILMLTIPLTSWFIWIVGS